jgi:hypothetical protein
MTAAERQFERFISAVRQFECDNGVEQFEQTLARLVATRPGRQSGRETHADLLEVADRAS